MINTTGVCYARRRDAANSACASAGSGGRRLASARRRRVDNAVRIIVLSLQPCQVTSHLSGVWLWSEVALTGLGVASVGKG